MPDIVIRHVDGLMADRIKTLARERQSSINDVVLNALRHGLGMALESRISADNQFDPDGRTISAGPWDATEDAVFEEALQALSMAQPTQLAPKRQA